MMAYAHGKRDMSPNARKAHKQGFFPLSKIRKPMLVENGFGYPVDFFKWLCKNGYVLPSRHHHTSASFRLTAFYSAKAIKFAAQALRLDNLFSLYKGYHTYDSLIAQEELNYARILVPCSYFGLKRSKDVELDCVCFNGLLIYSDSTIVNPDFIVAIKKFDAVPADWRNANTDKILHKIITIRRLRWETEMGSL